MTLSTTLIPALFSLGAVLTWGTSDFLGGYGARRVNALLLTTIAHAAGTTFMLLSALGAHAVFPSQHAVIWSCAAGLSGGGALALFYRSLASGNMGLTAPVAAVFSAAIPVAIGVAREGFPGVAPASGFLLAASGIWLVSRTEDGQRPKGIGLALIAGAGFAGYYLCTRQAGAGSALWIATLARASSFTITSIIVLLSRSFKPMDGQGVKIGVLAGCIDVTGSVAYILAAQSGRLDSTVVLSSLYPVVTVLLARVVLHEHFTRWRVVGMAAALLAVPLIAL
ncbi:MAG: DMT family transporter [Terriglobales bacterium]|jgi:drug/metabolite transporter (DMT)-like permease